MAREPAATDAHARDASQRDAKPTDVRSARPYIFQKGPLRGALRRLGSVAALAFLDVSGVALGLYSALAIRELVYGTFPPLWGVMWQAVEEWLPFLALITLLVFWQGGLYANREVRAGVGRILPCIVLVALLTAAFAIGSGHEFDTFGLVPTAVVTTTITIGVLRASYEAVTRDVLRVAGVRRRAVLVGRGEHLLDLRRALGVGPRRDRLRVRGRGRLRRRRPGPPGARRPRRAPGRARLDANGRADRDGGRPRRDGRCSRSSSRRTGAA